jgi:predicted nucleic acid-binding protein
VTLADTSVWIDYFRGTSRSRPLADVLEAGEIYSHAFVVGELALGHLGSQRARILEDLGRLPMIASLTDVEVLAMVESRRLFATGIGWVDAHLLAAAISAGALLWTFDGPLARIASRLGVDA